MVSLSQITPQKWTEVFFTNTSISIAHMEEKRGAYRVLMGTPEGKTPLGRPREDNIKIDIQKWDGEVWTGLIRLKTGTCGRHM